MLRLQVLSCLLQLTRGVYNPHLNFSDVSSIPDRRYDFCDLSLAVHNGSIQLDNVLRGIHIHMVAPLYDKPWLWEPEDNTDPDPDPRKITGFHEELLQQVARRGGFTYTLHTHPLSSFRPALSWSTYLIHSLERFDVSILTWLATDGRAKLGCSTPFSIMDLSLTGATFSGLEQDAFFGRLMSVFRPLHWEVWVLFIVSSVATATVYYVVEKGSKHDGDFDPESGALRKMEISLWLSLASFNGSNYFLPTTCRGRIISLTYSFLVLLLISAYTASLAAFLVGSKSVSQCRSFEDCVKGFNQPRICVQAGSAMEFYLKSMMEDTHSMQIKSTDGTPMKAGSAECDVFVDSAAYLDVQMADPRINPDCIVRRFTKPMKPIPGGWMVKSYTPKCTNLLMDALRVHMIHLQITGAIDKLFQEMIKSIAGPEGICAAPGDKAACQSSKDNLRGCQNVLDNERQQFEFDGMYGMLVIHGLGIGIALLFQACRHYRVAHRRPTHVPARVRQFDFRYKLASASSPSEADEDAKYDDGAAALAEQVQAVQSELGKLGKLASDSGWTNALARKQKAEAEDDAPWGITPIRRPERKATESAQSSDSMTIRHKDGSKGLSPRLRLQGVSPQGRIAMELSDTRGTARADHRRTSPQDVRSGSPPGNLNAGSCRRHNSDN